MKTIFHACNHSDHDENSVFDQSDNEAVLVKTPSASAVEVDNKYELDNEYPYGKDNVCKIVFEGERPTESADASKMI